MREVSPKELQKLNGKSFKNTQKIFRRRLREIAASGYKSADFKKGEFCHEDEIITWLRSLGLKVEAGTFKYYITWPEEEDIVARLRSKTFKILTSPTPHYAIGWLNAEFGTWTKDKCQWDYTCSKCGKHSEYVSDYCPNCGKKMKVEEGDKYDS